MSLLSAESVVETTTGPDHDICAVFKTAFHPTKGNIIEWSVKTSDDISLDGIEFSTLPSGLHVVDEDVIYFTKGAREGVCVFRRTKTDAEGQRGFKLGALGVLLEESTRSRPWLHVENLRRMADLQQDAIDPKSLSHYFEEYQVSDVPQPVEEDLEDEVKQAGSSHPYFHLSSFLRQLGPTSLLLYKYALARRRILIYTHPAVESACQLAWCIQAIADMGTFEAGKGRGEKVPVLGLVGLIDIDRLKAEGEKGRGWIACTTDAIFLERPQLFDLILDMTTTPRSASSSSTSSEPAPPPRPNFYISTRIPHPLKPKETHILRPAHFAWSDLPFWSSLERYIPPEGHPVNKSWQDPWQMYEDVCMMCAGMFVGSWRSSGVRLEGEEADLRRIQTRPKVNAGGHHRSPSGGSVRSAPVGEMSIPPKRNAIEALRRASGATSEQLSATSLPNPDTGVGAESESPHLDNVTSALLLLSQFQANTAALLASLSDLVMPPLTPDVPATTPGPGARPSPSPSGKRRRPSPRSVTLTPRDLLALKLGPLSAGDAKFVEWLALERLGMRVSVRRGWWDLSLGLLGW
ncbi:hypothetical protein DACRYDRAFT_118884 [Dacryopinax primogenitus]|uniref:DUF4484 domain-containing protein n=1 Tax=Dacryopinax primogenitus (strain DJM 731) TaxID=1858805 RepID=M5FXC7_DACPD|nr:uncharacterized protein DACRYDRAFT_118884 [Dacryopinax primogenitus]EJT98131.1 hypothetical protein DACRYDRAFT_118884 [Dacryopinax primogenitus]